MSRGDSQTAESASRRKFLAAAGAAGAVAVAGCSESGASGSSGSELSGSISITGSSTVFPLATAVAEQFVTAEEEGGEGNTEVDINVQSTGSGGGFENFFCPGDSDINNASRPIKDAERSSCEDNGVEPVEIKVATDALTIVVNNDNDWATELTVDQLQQIWGPDAGADQTWADIDSDWPDEEIERYGAAETSGTFDYLTETINGEGGAHTQDYEPTENDRSIVQGVQGSQYAIGYFGFSYFYNNPDAVTAVAVDDGDGPVKPSLDTAAAGEYTPLSRPLFTYPNANALSEDHIAEFCRYFVEQSGVEDVVAGDVGYVPNNEGTVEEMQSRLEDAIENAN